MDGQRRRGGAIWGSFLAALAIGAALVNQVEQRRFGTARERAGSVAVDLAHRIELDVGRSLSAASATAAVLRQSGRVPRLDALAADLMNAGGAVSSLLLAPGGVVAEVQPPEHGAALMGRNLQSDAALGDLARRLREERRAGTAGPILRGRRGPVLLGLFPVLLDRGGKESFWGFAGVEINLREMLARSDASDALSRGYEYEVFAEGAGATRPILVARSSESELDAPASAEALLPDSTIRIRLTPKRGWRDLPALATEGLLALLLASLVALTVRGMLREPERLRQQVEVRRRRLSEATRQLQAEVEQRRLAEQRREHVAAHDALTGLPNRGSFTRQLQAALDFSSGRDDVQIAILLVDLDRFKHVNDSLGQDVADRLLEQLARRLSDCQRPGNVLARIGGDEFGVLLSGIHGAQDAVVVADRLLQELKQPFDLGEDSVYAPASIGIAVAEGSHRRADELFRDADTAVRRAKAQGRARHVLFDEGMRSRVVERLHLETALRRAIEREEFQVYYQPIVSLESGRIRGFEGLVRWQHPERGLIPPVQFIPLAEESGLIIWIDRWVLGRAARQIRAWRERFGLEFISVNLSRRQLVQPRLVEHVAETLRDAALDGAQIKLEITESAVMENPQVARECLHRLRELGIGLCVDDFGTGYSSLSHLDSFPFHTVKIDQSFVRGREFAQKDVAILQTIIRLCKELSMEVVAEGVETPEQLKHLRELGCGLGQGYLFSRPLPVDEMETLLEQDPKW